MIKRKISQQILDLSKKYPVISITGPRQSGKTSLAKHLFPKYAYFNLEDLDVLEIALSDPRSFLKLGSGQQMIIDEIQRAPDLLSYIQTEVDEKKIDGQFVITGSQNFAISEGISQSLAGRVANFTLLPLSLSELSESSYKKRANDLQDMIFGGFYPAQITKDISAEVFYRNYLSTYVERDLRQIKNIGDLKLFQRFLQLVAGRVGQLVNYSSLANDVGVSYKTIESWLSILEASYIIYTLQPYHKNFGRRVVKSPKIYFYDVGLLCHLLKINSSEELSTHFAYGQIFENFVITEIKKNIENKLQNISLYFWRDSNGRELDLIIDQGIQLNGIELKSARTFSKNMLAGLEYWQNLADSVQHTSTLLYAGTAEQQVGHIDVKNWKSFLVDLVN